jgi:NADH dehydrogenase
VLVTGANGHLGRRLIAHWHGVRPVRAVVRSKSAEQAIRSAPGCQAAEVRVLDPLDANALSEAARGCGIAVHLVGIILENASTRYHAAHEQSCSALAQAAKQAGVERIVYLSILGSSPDSANACLASKGRAEQILLKGEVPAVVLRVPMVLGEGDIASRALKGQALAKLGFSIGGGRTWQQPIDAKDVVRAIAAACDRAGLGREALDLAGPITLRHRELVARVAALYDRRPVSVPVPLALVRALAWAFERALANPPITPAMLGVLQHDDRIDPGPACRRLGIELTGLDETLERCVGPPRRAGENS